MANLNGYGNGENDSDSPCTNFVIVDEQNHLRQHPNAYPKLMLGKKSAEKRVRQKTY